MDTKETIQQLNDMLQTVPMSDTQKEAVETAIKKLKSNNNRTTAIEVIKILTNLVSAGINILR